LKFKDMTICGDAIQQYQGEYKPFFFIPVDGWIEEVLHDLDCFMFEEMQRQKIEFLPCCSERIKEGHAPPKQYEGSVTKLKVKLEPEKMLITHNGVKMEKETLLHLNALMYLSSITCDVELAFAWKMGNRVGLTFICKELHIKR